MRRRQIIDVGIKRFAQWFEEHWRLLLPKSRL
jgi:hypothetical protein